MTLKPADNKRIYGFSFPDPVAEADIVEATDTAEDGLRSRQLTGVSIERATKSREDDIRGGDAKSLFFCPRIVSGATRG